MKRLRRNAFVHALLGAYTYFEFFFLAVVVFLPIMSVVTLFVGKRDPGRRLRGRWMRRFGALTSSLTPLWRFSVRGNAPPRVDRAPFVVVSNHLSTADPFLLSHLPWDMRWVAKAEVFRVPITGWLISLGGDISLVRGDRGSVARMFEEAKATLAAGVSVMLFPEGTRSADGQLQAFKDGAFELAISARVPVLPLAVRGTQNCRPKGSAWFGDATASVEVLEPVSTEGMTLADVPALREQVRERIAHALAKPALLAASDASGSPALTPL